MHLPHDAMLLRIFIGESDRWQHKPLYEAIVLKAREVHLAGATVLRGPMGFGNSSRLHTAKILRLSMDLPLVIELVDSEEKIQAFLPMLDQMMKGGLVTLETVRVTCCERKLVVELRVFQGIELEVVTDLPVVTAQPELIYGGRREAEVDKRYKQVIPDVLQMWKPKIRRYRRGEGVDATREHGL